MATADNANESDVTTPTFAAKPTLRGRVVTLRPVTAEDAHTLGELVMDPEIARLTGSVNDSTADLPRMPSERLAEIYGRWAVADDRIVWVAIDPTTDAIVGEVVLNELDPGNRLCNFRIWLAARNRGMGTEATELALRHAFAEVGLNRVELEVYDFNPRARRVYERVGFVHEGTRRQALLFDGEWVDAHSMAILAAEWAG